MLTAVHTLIYSDDPTATRRFLMDVLQWRHVHDPASDSGGDLPAGPQQWLIFATGPSELGVHPTGDGSQGWSSPRHHEIALICDDIEATMAELTGRGATFSEGPSDRGFGMCAMLQVPGADDILVYEPRHVTAYDAG